MGSRRRCPPRRSDIEAVRQFQTVRRGRLTVGMGRLRGCKHPPATFWGCRRSHPTICTTGRELRSPYRKPISLICTPTRGAEDRSIRSIRLAMRTQRTLLMLPEPSKTSQVPASGKRDTWTTSSGTTGWRCMPRRRSSGCRPGTTTTSWSRTRMREVSLIYYPHKGGLEDRVFRIRTERSSAYLPATSRGRPITSATWRSRRSRTAPAPCGSTGSR